MAEGGTDGSLKFSTKIDPEGFEQGLSTLERAIERLTVAIDRLNTNVADGFNGAGKAAAQTSRETEKIGEEAVQSEKKVKSLKEQMDAIQVYHNDTSIPVDASEAERRVQIRNPKLYGYDEGAMEYINGVKAAKQETNEFLIEISRLEDQMKGLGSQGMYFGDKEYDEAYLKLAKVKQALADYKKELTNPTQDAAVFPADSLRGKIERLKAQLRNLEAAGRTFGDTLYDSTYRGLKASEVELARYKKELATVQSSDVLSGAKASAGKYNGILGTVQGALSNMPALMGTVKSKAAMMFTPAGLGAVALVGALGMVSVAAQKFFGVIAGVGKFALNALKSLAMKAADALIQLGKAYFFAGKHTKKGNQQLSALDMLWKSVMFSFVFRAISGVSRALKEGSDNLTLYSNSFNQVVSSFVSSMGQLKNTISAAFLPITSVVIPAIDVLIQKIIQVINVIGQFISALGGKGTYIKAIKVNKDYAEGLEETGDAAKQAGKDAKKALAPFDDLIQLQQKGADDEDKKSDILFEEVEIDSDIGSFAQRITDAFKAEDYGEVGRIIGQKINEAIRNFSNFISWDRVGEKISQIITMLTTMFNDLVNEIEWTEFGEMLGNGINTIANTLYLFFKKIDWEGLGRAFGQSLNGLVDRVDWVLFGKTIGAYFQSKIEGLYGFVSEVDWPAIGKAIQESLTGTIKEIDWIMLGDSLAKGLSGLFVIAKEFVTTFDWKDLGSRIAGGISTFLRNFEWGTAGEAISGFITGLLDLIITFIEEMDWKALTDGIAHFVEKIDWSGVAGKILELLMLAISTAFGNFNAFIGKLVADKIKGAIQYFKDETEKCGGSIIEGILSGIIGAMVGLNKWILDHIFKPFMSGILSSFGIQGNSASSMEGIGEKLWEGFSKGIQALFMFPYNLVKNAIVDPFINAIKKLFGIDTSSAVLEEIGGSTVDGFNQGISKGQKGSESIVRGWGANIVSGFNGTISQGSTETRGVMKRWADNSKAWFWGSSSENGSSGLYAAFYNMAKRVNEGFAGGISDFAYLAKNAVGRWADDTIKKVKDKLDIHSPSRESYDIAKYFIKGFVDGIANMASSSIRTVSNWVDGISEILGNADLNLPVRINIPNAASYIPRVATGTVSPPRAGEFVAAQRGDGGSYVSGSSVNTTESDIKELIQELKRISSNSEGKAELVLDDTKFGQLIYKLYRKEDKRMGLTLVTER